MAQSLVQFISAWNCELKKIYLDFRFNFDTPLPLKKKETKKNKEKSISTKITWLIVSLVIGATFGDVMEQTQWKFQF